MKKFSKFSQEEDFKDDATGDNSGKSVLVFITLSC